MTSNPFSLTECLQVMHKKARLAHAQNPDAPDRALCGWPLQNTLPVSPESARCVVCEDLGRRSFIERG